jgi:hypothetical protein
MKLKSPELDISRVLSYGETRSSAGIRTLRTVGALDKLEELRLSMHHFRDEVRCRIPNLSGESGPT